MRKSSTTRQGSSVAGHRQKAAFPEIANDLRALVEEWARWRSPNDRPGGAELVRNLAVDLKRSAK